MADLKIVANTKQFCINSKENVCHVFCSHWRGSDSWTAETAQPIKNLEFLDVTFKHATSTLLSSHYFPFTVNNYNSLHLIHYIRWTSLSANNFL